MRNITFYLILCLIICSCNNANNSQITDQDSNSQNPTESFWNCWGIYQGTIPAADCPGIDVTLEINKDNTFQSKFVYQERNITFEDQGLYTINDSILTTIGEIIKKPSCLSKSESATIKMHPSLGYEILKDADCLLLITEWNEFRNPDFDLIKSSLKNPVIFDGRNQ